MLGIVTIFSQEAAGSNDHQRKSGDRQEAGSDDHQRNSDGHQEARSDEPLMRIARNDSHDNDHHHHTKNDCEDQ